MDRGLVAELLADQYLRKAASALHGETDEFVNWTLGKIASSLLEADKGAHRLANQ